MFSRAFKTLSRVAAVPLQCEIDQGRTDDQELSMGQAVPKDVLVWRSSPQRWHAVPLQIFKQRIGIVRGQTSEEGERAHTLYEILNCFIYQLWSRR